jgi:diadenosine tetraphosphate (Ap4A) HIT family hydrolase
MAATMIQRNECEFCAEILTGRLPAHLSTPLGAVRRIIHQNDRFVVLPSVSPLAPGHLLLLAQEHVTSMAQTDSLTLRSIAQWLRKVSEKPEFQESFLFEHGVGRNQSGACGVSHAHVHLVPSPASLYKYLRRAIEDDLGPSERDCSIEALESIRDEQTYLWMSRSADYGSVFERDQIQSQFVRRHFSALIGRSYWNWRDLTDWQDVRWAIAQNT